jgi:hypothetical protein
MTDLKGSIDSCMVDNHLDMVFLRVVEYDKIKD